MPMFKMALVALHSYHQYQQNVLNFELSVRRKHTTTGLFGIGWRI